MTSADKMRAIIMTIKYAQECIDDLLELVELPKKVSFSQPSVMN